MISVTETDDSYQITSGIRRPSIYLDHWALRSFSSNPIPRDRFFRFFETRGTLLFSWANVLEISGNTGDSADQIRCFLADLGEQWFPIEINPFTVIRREIQYVPGNDNPCFAVGLLNAYYPYIHGGRLSLSTIVDLTRHEQVKLTVQESIQRLTAEMHQTFDTARHKWRGNKTGRGHNFPNSGFSADRPAEFVCKGLMRLVVKENFNITANDVLDFCHATVSVAYGDLVLLDKRWVDLARKLKMPSGHVRVYGPQQVEQFLQHLEQLYSGAK